MLDSTSKLPMQRLLLHNDMLGRLHRERVQGMWELTRWRLDDKGIFCVDRITEKPITEKTYRDCAIYQDDNRIICKLAGVDFGFLVLVRL